MTAQFETAILDGPTVGWVTSSLNEKVEILDFFDLASIIEAIVFHEKIQLIFSNDLNEVEMGFYKSVSELLKPLINDGVIEIVIYEEPKVEKTKPSKKIEKSKKIKQLDADNDFTAWYLLQTVRFAVAERFADGNAVILPRQAPIYKLNRRVRVEHSICNLYQNYKITTEKARLARFVSNNNPINHFYTNEYWSLPMPPICLDVLKKCKNLNDVWNITGELRDQHKNIRKLHFDYGANHGDFELSPAKREKYAKKLKKDWNMLLSKWNTRLDSFRVADTTHGLRQESGLLSDLSGSEFSLAGEIAFDPASILKWGTLLQTIYQKVTGYWRLRKIHDSLESYWRISDKELYRQIGRLMKKPVTKADHEAIVKTEQEDKKDRKVVLVDFFPD